MIETVDLPEKNLRINHLRGKVSALEIIEATAEFYREGPLKNLIWDSRGADVSKIESTAVEEILEAVQRLSHSRSGGRTALVASEDLPYGIARMFDILSETSDLEFEVAVFRDLDEAMAWIASGREAPESGASVS